MHQRTWAVSLGAIAAVAALVGIGWLLANATSPPDHAPAEPPQDTPERTPVAAPPTVDRAPSLRTEPDAWIRAVDGDGLPAASATLTLVAAADATDTLSGPPSAHADADGVLRSPKLRGHHTIGIVRAAGHVPSAVQDPPDGALVRLVPAACLRVDVVDALGRPVPEVALVLTCDGTTADFLSTGAPERGIGHPLAARPRWVATTDGTGRALFEELPPGRFFVNVADALWIPLYEWGANSQLSLTPGSTNITITVDEMYGAAFAVAERKVVDSHFHVRLDGLNVLPHVTSRIALARAWLLARHPGSLVYAHRPQRTDRNPLIVRCQARTSDGRRWRGEGPLQPMRRVTAPIFLEPDDRPSRRIVIDLEDAKGSRCAELPILLQGSHGAIYTTTGEPTDVPHGEYLVEPRVLSKAVYTALRDFRIQVDAASPERFVATSEEPLVEVIVRPRLPSPIPRSVVEFYFTNEHGEGAVAANWRPERGPIRRWLAATQISLQVRSVAYKDLDLGPLPVVYGQPNEIVIDLEDKPPR